MLKYLALSLITSALSLVVAVLLINSGVFHDRIESKVQASTGLPVKLGRLFVPLKWPATVVVRASEVSTPEISARFRQAQVVFESLFEPYFFRIILTEPQISLTGPVASYSVSAEPSGGAGAPSADASPKSFGLALTIMNGEFKSPVGQIRNLNFEFEQKLWMKTPARLKASARVSSGLLPGEWPIAVQTDNLLYNDVTIKATAVRAMFAGLSAQMQISSLLKEERHRLLLEVKAPDLSKVPAPFELAATGWRGAVEMSAEVLKEGRDKEWTADGRAKLTGVGAILKWSKPGLSVDGPVSGEMEGKFSYVGGQMQVPQLKGDINLSEARIVASNILHKTPHTPLKISVEAASAAGKTVLKDFNVELWNFKGRIQGELDLKPPYVSRLTVNLDPTPLKGVDALVIPLKNSPVSGQLAMRADINGPLTEPFKTQIKIHSLSLKNFAAEVAYDGTGTLKARGPVSANLDVKGEIDQGQPKTFEATGRADLGSLALVAGPLRKEERQPLTAQFSIGGDGKAYNIRSLALGGFLGQIRVNGQVENPSEPKVNVRIQMSPLDVSELRMALPEYRESLPKGSLSGDIRLIGSIDSKRSWADWPLAVSGALQAKLPEYIIANAAPTPPPAIPDAAGSPPADEASPAGFLPKGELTEKLNLKMSVNIGVLKKDPLTVKGVATEGRIQAGAFGGQVTLGEVFGGRLQLSNLQVPLLEPLPLIQGQAQFDELVVQDVLDFIKPDYKTFATGKARGVSQFQTRLPADARFMNELKAKGQMVFSPITLNTVKVGQLLNDMAKKIPAVKLPEAKVDPLKGIAELTYDLASEVMTVAPLKAKDEAGSELLLNGKLVVPTFTADMAGNFAWAKSGIKGCVLEGNKDEQDRLVIPLAVKGSLMSPEFSMVADTVGKLAARALECEKKKFLEKATEDGGKKLEKEAKKVLEGILGK